MDSEMHSLDELSTLPSSPKVVDTVDTVPRVMWKRG